MLKRIQEVISRQTRPDIGFVEIKPSKGVIFGQEGIDVPEVDNPTLPIWNQAYYAYSRVSPKKLIRGSPRYIVPVYDVDLYKKRFPDQVFMRDYYLYYDIDNRTVPITRTIIPSDARGNFSDINLLHDLNAIYHLKIGGDIEQYSIPFSIKGRNISISVWAFVVNTADLNFDTPILYQSGPSGLNSTINLNVPIGKFSTILGIFLYNHEYNSALISPNSSRTDHFIDVKIDINERKTSPAIVNLGPIPILQNNITSTSDPISGNVTNILTFKKFSGESFQAIEVFRRNSHEFTIDSPLDNVVHRDTLIIDTASIELFPAGSQFISGDTAHSVQGATRHLRNEVFNSDFSVYTNSTLENWTQSATITGTIARDYATSFAYLGDYRSNGVSWRLDSFLTDTVKSYYIETDNFIFASASIDTSKSLSFDYRKLSGERTAKLKAMYFTSTDGTRLGVDSAISPLNSIVNSDVLESTASDVWQTYRQKFNVGSTSTGVILLPGANYMKIRFYSSYESTSASSYLIDNFHVGSTNPQYVFHTAIANKAVIFLGDDIENSSNTFTTFNTRFQDTSQGVKTGDIFADTVFGRPQYVSTNWPNWAKFDYGIRIVDSATNLLANGDFSGGSNYWDTVDGFSWSTVHSVSTAHRSPYTSYFATFEGSEQYATMTQTTGAPGLVGDNVFSLSVWAKSHMSAQVMRLRLADSAFSQVSSANFLLSTAWTRYTLSTSFIAAGDTVSASIIVATSLATSIGMFVASSWQLDIAGVQLEAQPYALDFNYFDTTQASVREKQYLSYDSSSAMLDPNYGTVRFWYTPLFYSGINAPIGNLATTQSTVLHCKFASSLADESGNDHIFSSAGSFLYESGMTEIGETAIDMSGATPKLFLPSADPGVSEDFNMDTASFTIEVIAKVANTAILVKKTRNTFGVSTGYSLSVSGDRFRASIGDGTNVSNISGFGSFLGDNQFHYFAITVDRVADTFSGYLDGEKLVTNDISAITGDIKYIQRDFEVAVGGTLSTEIIDELMVHRGTALSSLSINRRAMGVRYGRPSSAELFFWGDSENHKSIYWDTFNNQFTFAQHQNTNGFIILKNELSVVSTAYTSTVFPFDSGKPIHVVATWDSANSHLYINGVKGSTAITLDTTAPTSHFYLGNIQDPKSLHVKSRLSANGIISNFRIDGHTWTEDAVVNDMYATRFVHTANSTASVTRDEFIGKKEILGNDVSLTFIDDVGLQHATKYSYVFRGIDFNGDRTPFSSSYSIVTPRKSYEKRSKNLIPNSSFEILKDDAAVVPFWTLGGSSGFEAHLIDTAYIGDKGIGMIGFTSVQSELDSDFITLYETALPHILSFYVKQPSGGNLNALRVELGFFDKNFNEIGKRNYAAWDTATSVSEFTEFIYQRFATAIATAPGITAATVDATRYWKLKIIDNGSLAPTIIQIDAFQIETKLGVTNALNEASKYVESEHLITSDLPANSITGNAVAFDSLVGNHLQAGELHISGHTSAGNKIIIGDNSDNANSFAELQADSFKWHAPNMGDTGSGWNYTKHIESGIATFGDTITFDQRYFNWIGTDTGAPTPVVMIIPMNVLTFSTAPSVIGNTTAQSLQIVLSTATAGGFIARANLNQNTGNFFDETIDEMFLATADVDTRLRFNASTLEQWGATALSLGPSRGSTGTFTFEALWNWVDPPGAGQLKLYCTSQANQVPGEFDANPVDWELIKVFNIPVVAGNTSHDVDFSHEAFARASSLAMRVTVEEEFGDKWGLQFDPIKINYTDTSFATIRSDADIGTYSWISLDGGVIG